MNQILNFFKELFHALFEKGYIVKMDPLQEDMPSQDRIVEVTVALKQPQEERLVWDTPTGAFHAVRVVCDRMGLSVEQKNIICACIFQESRFLNTAKGENKDPVTKVVWSTDWGLAQINDHYHIGVGKDFPTVGYVLQNPEEAVKWMISLYKEGKLSLWSSYKSGAYKQWLLLSSPMWLLKGV